jgi:hypothetical protein
MVAGCSSCCTVQLPVLLVQAGVRYQGSLLVFLFDTGYGDDHHAGSLGYGTLVNFCWLQGGQNLLAGQHWC